MAQASATRGWIAAATVALLLWSTGTAHATFVAPFRAACATQVDAPGSTPFSAVQRTLEAACQRFSRYDRDGDGQPEISEVRRVRDGSRRPYERAGRGSGTVLVLCEDRLWRPTANKRLDLRPSLRTFVDDLAREGYHTALLVTSLYSGARHQDGLTVLALRDMLQFLWRNVPDLRAAILVGNYPNAFIVRQYYWMRDDGLVLRQGASNERKWNAVPHVRSIAEPVASPADIVLADLDGSWDRLYRLGPERLAGLLAVFPSDPARQMAADYQYTAERFEDFFLVQDGLWEEQAVPGGGTRFTFPGEPNNECTDADRTQANILARPEIAIGRINAAQIGIQPDPAIVDKEGRRLLDATGRPKRLEFADVSSLPSRLWVRSEAFERKLLQEYFARNHAYRTGAYTTALSPASFSTEWASSVPDMKASVPAWSTSDTAGLDHADPGLSVAQFVEWMRRPAIARAIKAHSSGTCSEFAPPKDWDSFHTAVGGHIWNWTREGSSLVPSLRPLGGQVQTALLRTLYENKALPPIPVFYFHTGCESLTPANYARVPYTSEIYGEGQIAQAFLMLGNGLAYIGRGKVFYDEPREFWAALGAGATWGDAWRRYFAVEGNDAVLARDGIGRKRAYFWSTLGDVTLTLRLPGVARSGNGSGRR